MSSHRTKTADGPALPRIRFVAAEDEAKATPHGSALILATLIERFKLSEIARELEMEKHHGVDMEHVLLVFLLSCTYGARSTRELERHASEDPSLAAVMDGVTAITQRVLRYFQARHNEDTMGNLLDRFVRGVQHGARFETSKDGILALDDSTIRKYGKHMEHITVVYDHCDKVYYLGYVVVSTCYCDKDKAFPVNFEFRIQTEEEKRRAQEGQLKKDAGIDFREKGALRNWLQVLVDTKQMPRTLSLVRSMVSGDNFQQADVFQVPWVAAANERLPLHDIDGRRRWLWEELVRKTLANKPDEMELEGLRLFTKEVSLRGYDRELDFVVVTDFAGNQLASLVLPRASHRERVERILDFFEREDEPESSKLHLGIELVRRAKEEANVRATTVAADSWYFVAWFVKALLEIPGLERVVSKLKVNQRLTFAGQPMEASQLWDIPSLQYRNEKTKGFKWAAVHAIIEGLGCVRLVLVREFDKKRPWREVAKYIVVCSDPHWGPLKAVAAYKMRWSIEVFYRTAKQRFALAEFHSKKFAAIYFHMTLVFLAYLMTAALRHTTPALADHTLGEIIDQYLRCLVSIKREGDELTVYLGPRFAQDFGLPVGPSP
jgi:hypothetical protein